MLQFRSPADYGLATRVINRHGEIYKLERVSSSYCVCCRKSDQAVFVYTWLMIDDMNNWLFFGVRLILPDGILLLRMMEKRYV